MQNNFDANDDSLLSHHINGKPVTCTQFRSDFNSALTCIHLTTKYPQWRAHSLCHSEITDQVTAGTPFNSVLQFCRHVLGSKLYEYTLLSA